MLVPESRQHLEGAGNPDTTHKIEGAGLRAFTRISRQGETEGPSDENEVSLQSAALAEALLGVAHDQLDVPTRL